MSLHVIALSVIIGSRPARRSVCTRCPVHPQEFLFPGICWCVVPGGGWTPAGIRSVPGRLVNSPSRT